ncbi:hypothetical protein KA531_04005 [Candidatus Saccharibacteria bacterium]|nr:hypothetical protein [Candidatus Saccharibacteria bacterium]
MSEQQISPDKSPDFLPEIGGTFIALSSSDLPNYPGLIEVIFNDKTPKIARDWLSEERLFRLTDLLGDNTWYLLSSDETDTDEPKGNNPIAFFVHSTSANQVGDLYGSFDQPIQFNPEGILQVAKLILNPKIIKDNSPIDKINSIVNSILIEVPDEVVERFGHLDVIATDITQNVGRENVRVRPDCWLIRWEMADAVSNLANSPAVLKSTESTHPNLGSPPSSGQKAPPNIPESHSPGNSTPRKPGSFGSTPTRESNPALTSSPGSSFSTQGFGEESTAANSATSETTPGDLSKEGWFPVAVANMANPTIRSIPGQGAIVFGERKNDGQPIIRIVRSSPDGEEVK